jgi:hypothetical protein
MSAATWALTVDTIDRANWLDIRQRTEDKISHARSEYDRLTPPAPCSAAFARLSRSATVGRLTQVSLGLGL